MLKEKQILFGFHQKNYYKDIINLKRLKASLIKKNQKLVIFNALYYSKMYETRSKK